jgi:hypothetical protein
MVIIGRTGRNHFNPPNQDRPKQAMKLMKISNYTQVDKLTSVNFIHFYSRSAPHYSVEEAPLNCQEQQTKQSCSLDNQLGWRTVLIFSTLMN